MCLPRALITSFRGRSRFARRQEAFGIYRSRAARTGGGYGLTVGVIHAVSTRKDARHVRPRSGRLDLDVSLIVQIQLVFEDPGIRLVADSRQTSPDKET